MTFVAALEDIERVKGRNKAAAGANWRTLPRRIAAGLRALNPFE